MSMTTDDKRALQNLRSSLLDPEQRKTVRKAINYTAALENKLHTVRTLLRLALNEASTTTSTAGAEDTPTEEPNSVS